MQEKLLVKCSSQYHALMKKTFANSQHKFDSRTTSAHYVYKMIGFNILFFCSWLKNMGVNFCAPKSSYQS